MSDVFDYPGPFKAGDVVRIVKASAHPELLGALLTITGPLKVRKHRNGVVATHSTDMVHDGMAVCVMPDQVRGKRPPTTGEESVLALFKGMPQAVPA